MGQHGLCSESPVGKYGCGIIFKGGNRISFSRATEWVVSEKQDRVGGERTSDVILERLGLNSHFVFYWTCDLDKVSSVIPFSIPLHISQGCRENPGAFFQ